MQIRQVHLPTYIRLQAVRLQIREENNTTAQWIQQEMWLVQTCIACPVCLTTIIWNFPCIWPIVRDLLEKQCQENVNSTWAIPFSHKLEREKQTYTKTLLFILTLLCKKFIQVSQPYITTFISIFIQIIIIHLKWIKKVTIYILVHT